MSKQSVNIRRVDPEIGPSVPPEKDKAPTDSDALRPDWPWPGRAPTDVAAPARAHAEERRPFGSAQDKPGSCINCGQVDRGIDVTAEGMFRCPQCRHEWTAEDEKAPFRRR